MDKESHENVPNGKDPAGFGAAPSAVPGADVVIAECGGSAWLIHGEQHIDNLLANTLTKDITIQVITCESKSAVDALWFAWNEADVSEQWLIHPAIVRRARGQAEGAAGQVAIQFTAWSAALDGAAAQAVAAMAARLADRPAAMLVLVRHVAADAPAVALDIANLRSALLEARLAELGIAAGRTRRETVEVAGAGQGDVIILACRD